MSACGADQAPRIDSPQSFEPQPIRIQLNAGVPAESFGVLERPEGRFVLVWATVVLASLALGPAFRKE